MTILQYTQSKMYERTSEQSFAVSRNLHNATNIFVEAEIYKNIRINDTTSNSVSTSNWPLELLT